MVLLCVSHVHEFIEAIHAAEHAILNRFAMSVDLRTECKAAEKEYKATESKRKRPARHVHSYPFII
jgi:DEAD/DEAH box helicase domain-containing protein